MDWLSLICVALLVAITYMQALQGIVSASIMCVLTLLSAAFAFATYEWIALSFLNGPLGDLSLSVAFVGAFVIPLAALRLAADAWISRANLVPVLIDRVGASAIGLVSAYVLTGMLALGILMLPFGGAVLGHVSLDEESGEVNSLWLSPDGFVASYASLVSGGLFSGRQRFTEVHPDLVEEVAWSQSTPRAVRHVAPAGSISVVRVESPDYIFDKTPGKPARRNIAAIDPKYDRHNPPDGKQWYLVRVALGEDAKDEDGKWRFGRRQIRLVGSEGDGPAANFTPVAINDNDRPTLAVRTVDGTLYRPSSGNEVDFVFEVSEDFVPHFIEYMVGARADLGEFQVESSFEPSDSVAPTDDDRSTAAAAPRATGSRGDGNARPASAGRKPRARGPGGRVTGVRVATNMRFGDNLPVVMSDYDAVGLEESRGAMSAGHVFGDLDGQGGRGPSAKLTKFEVPSDKRLFHLEVEQLRARSGFGKALSLARTTVKNYRVTDRAGNVYQVVGQYVIADVDGVQVIEVQYFPGDVAASGRGGIRSFRRVKRQHLDDRGTELVYLFLVDPGAELVQFSTGGPPTDLSDLGLVAPN